MAGTKRKTPGKPSKPVSDFKRLKSRVGKPAGNALNETNTAFKKTQLYVAGKSDSQSSAGTILSRRGKSINDLSTQASHPAAKVRQSSIKGLLSILMEMELNSLRPHLHTLLQIASRGFVDDDPEVREIGYLFLKEILAKYDDTSISPFLPLIVAYACSGLHSLDRHMRFDSCRAVGYVCQCLGPRMKFDQSVSFIPPFVGLLADHRGAKLMAVLKSLNKVLSILEKDVQRSFDFDDSPLGKNAMFYYQPGGRSRNAFMGRRRCMTRDTPNLSNLHEVLGTINDSSALVDEEQKELTKSSSTKNSSFLDSFVQLQSKLCDVLVEALNDDREVATTKPSTSDLIHVLQAMKVSIVALKSWRRTLPSQHSEKIVNTLVEVFPLKDSVGMEWENGDDLELEECDGLITHVLLNLDNGIEISRSRRTIDSIISFWLPREGEDVEHWSSCRLAAIEGILDYFSLQSSRFSSMRKRIMNELYDYFLENPTREIARSLPGRKAATMLAKGCVEDLVLPDASRGVPSTAILPSFVKFLHFWSSDFPTESLLITESIASIFLAVSPTQNGVTAYLQDSVALLFEKGEQRLSTFEVLSHQSRREILGLIRMLGYPRKQILDVLADVCAAMDKPGTLSIGDDVFGVIFSIRKTLSMTDYLTFVIASMGVPRMTSAKATHIASHEDFLTSLQLLDYRVSRSVKAAIECGPLQMLKMLYPQLLAWTIPNSRKHMYKISALRCRVALCISAALLAELARAGIAVKNDVAASKVFKLCVNACCELISLLVNMELDEIPQRIHEFLLSPVAVIANFDSSFVGEVVRTFESPTRKPSDRTAFAKILDTICSFAA